ncbi:MAG: 1-acyl-sn-glycerol-3-phosphate acyltransferase [Paludibacteraceae bacterium]|nr:1-acyl-sn-glycerol-3-phosphate acyltransferase [Paludibacteraceae bacterium]
MSKIKLLYQYLIALPILLVLTIVCALITIVCIPWKNSWWLNRIQAFWARSFCRLFFIPVTVRGVEHIRCGQSYVFVSNHQSNFDIFVIYGWLPVVFKWLMKQEISRIPLVGTACRAAGHIFIDRRHAKAAAESLIKVEKQLTDGVSTVIFPEGTRTENGEIGPFKRGAFQIAWDLHLPVIPIRLDGCYEVMNRHAKSVTRHPVTMTIMPEIDLRQCSNIDEAINIVRNQIIAG